MIKLQLMAPSNTNTFTIKHTRRYSKVSMPTSKWVTRRIWSVFWRGIVSLKPEILPWNKSAETSLAYHISLLLQVSKIAKDQGDHSLSSDLVERALFTFGRVSLSSFSTKL